MSKSVDHNVLKLAIAELTQLVVVPSIAAPYAFEGKTMRSERATAR
jgi:hypothetical protein